MNIQPINTKLCYLWNEGKGYPEFVYVHSASIINRERCFVFLKVSYAEMCLEEYWNVPYYFANGVVGVAHGKYPYDDNNMMFMLFFDSEEEAASIEENMKYIRINRFDDNLTNEELIKLLEND